MGSQKNTETLSTHHALHKISKEEKSNIESARIDGNLYP